MSYHLLKKSKSKPRDFLEFAFEKSILVIASGIYLILSSVIIGAFVAFVSLFTSTTGELSAILSIFEIPITIMVCVVFVSTILYLSKIFKNMSRLDPHGEAHGSDFLLGIVFASLAYYGISIGHITISELEEPLLSTEFLYGSFIYVIVAGWYAVVAGVFLNGVTRILIHAFGIRNLLESTWRDLRLTGESLRLSKWFRVYGVVSEYRRKKGLSRIAAVCEIFFSGLALVEPVNPDDHELIRERAPDTDETRVKSYPGSTSESWYSVFVYVLAALSVFSIFSWGYVTESTDHPIREIGVILLFISVFTGYLSVPAYMRSVSYFDRNSKNYNSRFRVFIATLFVGPLFSLIVASRFYNWATSIETMLVVMQSVLLIGFFCHLISCWRSNQVNSRGWE